MKLNKLLVVSILILAILTIGAASASDNITYDDLLDLNDDKSVKLSVENEDFNNNVIGYGEILTGKNNQTYAEDINENLLASGDELYDGNDLYELINSSKNGEIKLEHDYSRSSSDSIDDLNINMVATFDGQGHIIDSLDFEFTGEDITIKNTNFGYFQFKSISSNFIFINCSFFGSSIKSEGNCNIINCTFDVSRVYSKNVLCMNSSFTSCHTTGNGGAIQATECRIINTEFNDCCSICNSQTGKGGYGGAIYAHYSDIDNCTFIKCYSESGDGAVFSTNGKLNNSRFINCTSYEKVVSLDGEMSNCKFINCTAKLDVVKVNGYIINSEFINCSSTEDSDYFSCIELDGEMSNCKFINCTGGCIYLDGEMSNCKFINCTDKLDVVKVKGYLINCEFINISGRHIIRFYEGSSFLNSNFQNCSGQLWASGTSYSVFISNITIDGKCYDLSLLDIKDNCHIDLDKDCTIEYSPLYIGANNVVIDGHGHYFNSEIKGSIVSNGNNVTLKNIKFNDTSYIYFYGLNSTLINCSFKQGYDIIKFYKSGTTVINCSFIDCAENCISLYFSEDINQRVIPHKNINIMGCNFINCSGCSVNFYGKVNTFNISDCNFINCSNNCILDAYSGTISKCSFVNDSAYGKGILRGCDLKVIDCKFMNCSSRTSGGFDDNPTYGGAIYFTAYGCNSVINCRFINNSAKVGSAIYFDNNLGEYYNLAQIINTTFEGDEWYSDYPVDISNVTVNGVKVSLWDNLKDNSHISLNKNSHIEYSPILINKNNVVIDGAGYTVSSTPYFSFYITGVNVTLKNFNFNSTCVYSLGYNSSLVNCIFNNCSEDYKGIVTNKGIATNILNVINCKFINCSSNGASIILYHEFAEHKKYNGLLNILSTEFINCSNANLIDDDEGIMGSIVNCTFVNDINCLGVTGHYGYFYKTSNITDCTFINFNGQGIRCKWGNIINCNFVNCYNSDAGRNGGAIYSEKGSNIRNCSFVNCSTSKPDSIYSNCYGGAIYAYSSNITDCIFINCSAFSKGGAIYAEGYSIYDDFSIANCKFINCTDNYNDAVYFDNYEIYSEKINYYLSDSCFIGCNWSSEGFVKFSNVTVDGVLYHINLKNIYDNNTVIELEKEECPYLSPIYVKGNNVVIDGKGNTLAGDMNEIFYIVGSNVTVKNIIFKNGGIYSVNKNTTIINCTFIDCNSTSLSKGGGAIHGLGSVINSKFINCSDHFRGGAISGLNEVINCSFMNCSCFYLDGEKFDSWIDRFTGGAIYGVENISNCQFVNCFAGGGGAISSSGNIFNCSFINCSAFTIAGAVDNSKIISDCIFINDTIIEDGCSVIRGGSIYNCTFIKCHGSLGIDMSTVVSDTVHNCIFIDCMGGVYNTRKNSEVYNCSFINVAFEPAVNYGSNISYCNFINCSRGAIYIEGYGEDNDYYISYCNFTNCSYKFGGAIRSMIEQECGTVNINYCSFINCMSFGGMTDALGRDYLHSLDYIWAGGFGGAIYSSNTNILNCSFINCSALKYMVDDPKEFVKKIILAEGVGGAIYLAVSGSIINCSFSGNDADYNQNWYASYYVNCCNNTVEKSDSYIHIQNTILDYGDEYIVYPDVMRGVHNLTVSIVNNDDAVVKFVKETSGSLRDYPYTLTVPKIYIYNLPAGTYTLNITTIPKENFTAVNRLVQITINKANSSVKCSNITFGFKDMGYSDIELNGAKGVIAKVIGHDEAVVRLVNNTGIEVSNLNPGNYTLNIKTVPDENHYSSEINVSVSVLAKKPSSVTLSNDIAFSYGGSGYCNVDTDGATGISAEVIGHSEAKVNVGGGKITVSNLAPGNYILNVKTVPEKDYYATDANVSVAVSKSTPSISIIKTNENAVSISVLYGGKLLDSADITYTVGNKTKSTTLKSSNLLINDLSGNVTVKVVFKGNEYYNPCENSSTLTFKTKITPLISIAKKNETTLRINVTYNGKYVPSAKITYTVGSKTGTRTISSGLLFLRLSGEVKAKVVFEGNDDYNSCEKSVTLYFKGVETPSVTPEISIPSLDGVSGDDVIPVSLPLDATGKITLDIAGKSYEFNVSNGKANVKLPDLVNGDYPYTITYSGDSKYSSFTNNGTLTKEAPKVNPVITASNVKVTYNAGSYYTIMVYGTDGKLADGVTVKITGKISKTLTTTNGVAKFKVTQVPGTYKITISALGKSVSKTITVKHLVTLKAATLKKSAKKLTLQATLTKVNGKYLKKKTITFKINGKKVATAKTNNKGVAKITINNPNVVKNLKVGKKVTYQATYLKDTVKKTTKIKK